MSEQDPSNRTTMTLLIAMMTLPVLLVLCLVFGILGFLLVPLMLDEAPTDAFRPARVGEDRVNRLVLVNTRGQVETVSPTGEDRRMLTEGRRIYQFPSWAPDNSAIAVIGVDGARGGVYLLPDSAESQPVTLYEEAGAPIYHAWSPDSTRVSFIANIPRGLGLYVADIDLPDSASLLASGQPFYWDWTDDSSELFIHTGSPGERSARLAFIAPDGDGSGETIAAPGYFQSPDVAPSGEYVAYAQLTEDEVRQLVVRSLADNGEIVTNHNHSTSFAWSPQGDELAYIGPPPSDRRIAFGPLYMLDVATGESREIASSRVTSFFWSPDGERIAYLTLRLALQGQQAAAGELLRVGQSAQAQQSIQFDLWVMDADGEPDSAELIATLEPHPLFIGQFLPFYDQYARSHRIWSPAGDAIALPIRLNDESVIAVYPVDGSAPQVIPNGIAAFWSYK